MDIDGKLAPYVRLAIDDVLHWPVRIDERIIFDYELLYIMEGKATVTIESRAYEATGGDIFLLKPNKRHSILLEKGGFVRQPHAHFDLFWRDDSEQVKVNFRDFSMLSETERAMIRPDDTVPGLKMELPDHLTVRNLRYFENLLFDLIREWHAIQPFKQIFVNSAFLRLWGFLLQENNLSRLDTSPAKIEKYLQVKQYIEENIHRAVSLDELAKHFYINKFHLRRTFEQLFDISPTQYSRIIRVQKARNMICYTNLTISEIANQLGFSSLQAFSHTFREVEGTPPGYYRRE